ncbi:MAG: hypothetical protein WC497_03065 [Patescibacteria group bacterium]
MRRISPYLFILTCLFAAQPARSQEPLSLRFMSQHTQLDRYLGTTGVGQITGQDIKLFVDNPRRTRLLALEIENFDNDVPDSIGLELPEKRRNIGVCLPLTNHFALRYVHNSYEYNISNDFTTEGYYPCYDDTTNKIMLGFEEDNERSFLAYGYGRRQLGAWQLYLAASQERYDKGMRQKERVVNERLGLAACNNLAGLQLFASSTYNFETEQPTWSAGLARPVPMGSRQPGLYVSGRLKPEATFVLAMFTLGTKAFSQEMTTDLLASSEVSTMHTSRIIRGRDFDVAGGSSSGYKVQEMSDVAGYLTLVDTEVTKTASVRELEAALYGTLSWCIGRLTNPFIGFAHSESRDLVYDPVLHRMDDPGQSWNTVLLGGKIDVLSRPDPRGARKTGYLKLESKLRFSRHGFDGLCLEGTFWL